MHSVRISAPIDEVATQVIGLGPRRIFTGEGGIILKSLGVVGNFDSESLQPVRRIALEFAFPHCDLAPA